MKKSEVLLKAADIILEKGHSHHTYVGADESVCAIGAIRIACGAGITPRPHNAGYMLSGDYDYYASSSAQNVLYSFLIEHRSHKFREFDTIPSWNDNNNEATVVAAMKAAAEWVKDRNNTE